MSLDLADYETKARDAVMGVLGQSRKGAPEAD